MSSFDFTGRALRLAVTALSLASLALVSSCQVRPLYADGPSGVSSVALASIGIAPAPDRVTQQVRNRLIFLLAGGMGEAANPQYKLAMSVGNKTEGVLYDQRDSRDTNSDMATAGRVVVTADFNLTRVSDGKTIASGKRSAVALVDFSVQEFSKLRAIRDGQDRAAREVAETIRADLAAALAREPAPVAVVTKG
ncbi:hypothetical protein BJF93_15750 [Xaviernesmea oryzae]|uniref:LPS-assembly lipoprotein n=1 Tax=Xaviernesmea oryzae TaxID=464029 RepID=A0A1Q9AY76_9HYPH|nr:hypothetical protein [Xaviernesmea oryzae]OLP60396.1 hypothetical protein BJF93_15750 [Xaviernesmea oryzae]SEK20103.1 LPS-assembly lipoprotein [Xaviernesmea oryzae]